MGEWQRAEIGYLRPNRLCCRLCGQPIAGRHWVGEVEGELHTFCDPGHEETYRTYWLPRYGAKPEATE